MEKENNFTEELYTTEQVIKEVENQEKYDEQLKESSIQVPTTNRQVLETNLFNNILALSDEEFSDFYFDFITSADIHTEFKKNLEEDYYKLLGTKIIPNFNESVDIENTDEYCKELDRLLHEWLLQEVGE